MRSTNGRREDEERERSGSGACHIPSGDKMQRCSGHVRDQGGRDAVELIRFFRGCAAVWLSKEEPRSFWTVSLNAASLPVMERCSRTRWDGREVAGRRLIRREGRKREELEGCLHRCQRCRTLCLARGRRFGWRQDGGEAGEREQ